jgi:membrane protein YqaA with SNARE-associated domain
MSEPEAAAREGASFWRTTAFRLLVLALVLGISGLIFAFRDHFAELAALGYSGIFAVSILSSATIILPAPSLALVFAMGSALPPLLVGLSAGAGEALGELTGYAAGFGGRAIITEQKTYEQLRSWMQRRGGLTLFVLSVIPNPVFDLAGIAAGTLHYPLWRFLAICWAGKSVKTTLVAFAGAMSLNMIKPAREPMRLSARQTGKTNPRARKQSQTTAGCNGRVLPRIVPKSALCTASASLRGVPRK